MLERSPLSALRYDVDEIDRIADLRDRRTGDHAVKRLGQLFGAEARLTDPVLVDIDAQLLVLLGPVVIDVAHEVGRAQDIGDLIGIVPGLFGRRRAHSILHRPAHGRPELEPRDPDGRVGEALREQRLEPRLHAVAGLEVLRDDHDLRHEIVVELHVERQIEADRAAADIR